MVFDVTHVEPEASSNRRLELESEQNPNRNRREAGGRREANGRSIEMEGSSLAGFDRFLPRSLSQKQPQGPPSSLPLFHLLFSFPSNQSKDSFFRVELPSIALICSFLRSLCMLLGFDWSMVIHQVLNS